MASVTRAARIDGCLPISLAFEFRVERIDRDGDDPRPDERTQEARDDPQAGKRESERDDDLERIVAPDLGGLLFGGHVSRLRAGVAAAVPAGSPGTPRR